MDTGPPDPLGHLRKARKGIDLTLARLDTQLDALMDARHALTARLRDLDELIEKFPVGPDGGFDLLLTGPDSGRAAVETKRYSNVFDASDSSASTRTAILHLLRVEGQPLETNEIVRRVQEMVDSQPATTRSLLSKLAESGDISRVRRGVYRSAGPVDVRSERQEISDWVDEQVRKQAEQATQEDDRPSVAERASSRNEIPSVHKPTAEEQVMAAGPSEEAEPDLSDEDYRELYREAQQARLEDQADREESSS